MKRPLLLLPAILLLCAIPTEAAVERIVFPHDPCVLDLKRDFGAKGDGVADDTDALQSGIESSSGGKGPPSKVLFIPNGTDRVTRTLVVKSAVGPWVYGESRDGVIIRLADGMPTNVTAALRTHPSDTAASSADFFMRNFRNLTIDVGRNPHADGVRWYGNNSSSLKDVRVIGNGKVGINAGFLGQNGPNLVQDALIEGSFETGVRCAWSWGQALSRITVRGARQEGVSVNATAVGIEDLAVENTPVALRNEYPNDWTWWGGVVALAGGRFNGGDPAQPAITNSSVLYARDVQATGFKQALYSITSGGCVAGDTLGEYLSHPAMKLFPETPETALRLPAKPEPRVAWETNAANWVCANEYGAKFGDNRDDTAALQAAIDAAAAAGKTVVYLRPAFDVVDASFSAAGVRELSFGNTYPVKARVHRGEAVRTEKGGGGIGWALFRSGPNNPAPAVRPAAKLNTAFPLKVSENQRHLVEQNGTPFFVMGDTPWFIQKLAIEDVRMLMDDRVSKGFNTLFLELLDDSRIPSVDGYGNAAFQTDTDITRPMEAYWKHAEQVVEEAEQRGLFVIHSELWYGAGGGLWMHHVKPENAKVYGAFIGRRFARFNNLMWMHAGDRNPDPSLAENTRILAREIQAAAPHHLHTVHNAHEFASARFHHEDRWLDVNLGYTYGAAYLHILPEYQRSNPVRPIILGETGYEAEPNAIELLPDASKGDLWTPFRIRRNAWWAALSGASGYCAGTRLWRWEPNWRETMQVRSTREAPNLLRGLSVIAWWKLVPDTQHQFVTAGFGEWKRADYATAAVANDGSCAAVYLPTPRTFTADLAKLKGSFTARWFDPASGQFQDVPGLPSTSSGKCEFAPPGKNAAGESDWVLVLGPPRMR